MMKRINAARFAYRIWWSRRRGVQIGEDCVLIGIPAWGSEPFLISIGNHVLVAGRVTFLTHDGATWVLRKDSRCKDVIKYGRITIHDNCFIGFGATLMPGVEVGPNSVVGAGAIVSRSVPPNTIAAGNPARPVMNIEEYALRCIKQTPKYDHTRYYTETRAELLRLFPRPW